jgi:hypothetical protein
MRGLSPLLVLAVGLLCSCTLSPVTNSLRFSCTTNTDCAEGFTCRAGECREGTGGGGMCFAGEVKTCTVGGCSQVCGADSGFQDCAPKSGGGFDINPEHCGQCGRACSKAAGLGCVNSRCTCLTDLDCPGGDLCAPGGICASSTDVCAAMRCPNGQVCRQGSCKPVGCVDGCGKLEICDATNSLCRPIAACSTVVACDGGGFCEGAPRLDGSPCDDGLACTSPDQCLSGQCIGAPNNGTFRDADGDGHGDPAMTSMICPAPMGYVSTGDDCNDSDSNVFQLVQVVGDLDRDGFTGSQQVSAQCVGASAVIDGGLVYKAADGGYPWFANPSAQADCDDTSASVFQTKAVARDQDQDGLTATTTTSNQCVGDPMTINNRTYYADATGAFTWLLAATNPADCNDTNAAITGVSPFYPDLDGDGAGAGTAVMLCTATGNYVGNNTDCNDSSPLVKATMTVYADLDQDGWTVGAAAPQCTGNATVVGGRTYYRAASGAYTWIATSLGADCDDGDSTTTAPTNWYADADNDSFGAGAPTLACSAPGGKPAANNSDCNDGSSNVFATRSVYADADQDGYTDNSQANQCTGSSTTVNGRTYFKDASGGYTWIATSLGLDCDPATATFYRTLNNLVADNDRDGYPPSNSQSSQCVGASSTFNGRTYYASSVAGQYWMDRNTCINFMGGNCQAPFDCYDANAAANPVQAAYYVTDRGDGSFDYNCSGTVTSNTGFSVYCVQGMTTTFFTDPACLLNAFSSVQCTSSPAIAFPAACGQLNSVGGVYSNSGACSADAHVGGSQIACH